METNKESKFWTFLASLLNFEAPLWNWRKRLNYGFDFDSFQGKYLLPTDKTAALIMCPINCDYSCGFRKVRENDDGSFRAVCHKKKKDSFPILDSEILFYKVDYNVLLPEVAQTLGIQPLITPYQTWDEAWEIGTLRIANQTLPVFFTLRNWNHKVIDLILNLNRMCNKPYLLLVTSAKMISPTSQKALEDSSSLFIPLNEVLDFNQDAEVILTHSVESYFENVPGLLPHVEDKPENIFRKCGDAWEIRFQGSEKFMLTTGNTGASYLHFMLARPNVATPVTEIMHCVSGESEDYVSADRLDEGDISSGFAISDFPTGQSDAIADETALRQYQEELGRLKKSIEEAEYVGDNATAELLKQELDNILEMISPNGQKRTLDDPLKKIANSFRNAVNRTLDRIQEHDNCLANHLRSSLRFGINPVYVSAGENSWQC